ncbi:MAG: hypothetical protein RIS85_2634, partial [Pseudomonadota bacterium]
MLQCSVSLRLIPFDLLFGARYGRCTKGAIKVA